MLLGGRATGPAPGTAGSRPLRAFSASKSAYVSTSRNSDSLSVCGGAGEVRGAARGGERRRRRAPRRGLRACDTAASSMRTKTENFLKLPVFAVMSSRSGRAQGAERARQSREGCEAFEMVLNKRVQAKDADAHCAANSPRQRRPSLFCSACGEIVGCLINSCKKHCAHLQNNQQTKLKPPQPRCFRRV